MAEHYTRNTVKVLAYCPTCNRQTMHRVDDRRLGCCLETHVRRSEVSAAERREIYRLMTPAQEELRQERMAIMTAEGVPEAEAVRFCDGNPALYGMVGGDEEQCALVL